MGLHSTYLRVVLRVLWCVFLRMKLLCEEDAESAKRQRWWDSGGISSVSSSALSPGVRCLSHYSHTRFFQVLSCAQAFLYFVNNHLLIVIKSFSALNQLTVRLRQEEVRELKQKLSQHALLDPTASSTSLAAAIGMNVPTSAAAAAGTGAQVTPGIPDCTTNANLSSSTTVAPGRVTEGSIAEQLARGMYGTGGFAGLSLQPSSQQQEAFEQGQQGQQQRSQSIPGGLKAAHDVVMSAPTGVTSVEDEGAIRTARAVAGEEEETVTNVTGGGAGEGLRAGGARVGSVEAGWEWNEVRGKGPAPSHGGMEQVSDISFLILLSRFRLSSLS